MAGENDIATLLQILCDAGAEQCVATGAAVLKAVANEGEIGGGDRVARHRARTAVRAARLAGARSVADARRRRRRELQRLDRVR